MINKISSSNTLTSVLLFAIDVKTNKDVLFLPIEDIIHLKDNKQVLEKGKKLSAGIKASINKLIDELKDLGLQNVYTYNIQNTNDQLLNLKGELQKIRGKKAEAVLKEKIYLLEYCIYLWHTEQYVVALYNLMRAIIFNKLDAIKYARISNMLNRQATYIIEMKKFKTNVEQYKTVLPNKREELAREQEEVNDRYETIVQTYNKNVTYVEKQFNTFKITIQDILQAIELIDASKKNPRQLCAIKVLIDRYNIIYIQDKRDKILNILVSLNVIKTVDDLTPTKLRAKLQTCHPKNLKRQYILKKYIYLYSKYEYLNSLSDYIFILQTKNEQYEDIDYYKKRSEEKLKAYLIEKEEFQVVLQRYLQLIESNPKDIYLQQCIPIKEDIDDIFNHMNLKDKLKDKKLLIRLRKETKTGIILPVILIIGGTFVIGGIWYITYGIIKPNKAKVTKPTTKKPNIARK